MKFMFKLIKFIIWIAGIVAVSLFVLNYFGYEVNKKYFEERKVECEKRINDCKLELLHKGTDNAQCNFHCLDLKLIIKKK